MEENGCLLDLRDHDANGAAEPRQFDVALHAVARTSLRQSSARPSKGGHQDQDLCYDHNYNYDSVAGQQSYPLNICRRRSVAVVDRIGLALRQFSSRAGQHRSSPRQVDHFPVRRMKQPLTKHDRVNYAVVMKLKVDTEACNCLNLQIDTKICTMYEYLKSSLDG